MTRERDTTVLILLLIPTMVFWGGTWTAGKLVAPFAAAETIIFWRYLFAAVATAPLLWRIKKSPCISLRGWLWMVFAGVLLFGFGFVFIEGLRVGLAGAGGVLVTTLNPILTFGWTLIFFPQRPHKSQLIGLLLGLCGGAVILNIWSLSAGDLLDSGNLYFLLAPCLWSLVTVVSQKAQAYTSYVLFSVVAYIFAAVLSLPFALGRGLLPSPEQPILLWGSILYLAIPATAFASSVYFLASSKLGSRRSSSFIFLVPVSTVLISWAVLAETPRLTTILGGALSIAAVYLINRRVHRAGVPTK